MPRQAGKFGRRPLDPARRRLTLEKYLDPRTAMSRSGLPPVALTADVDRAGGASWPMYLNDQLGDCTIAALGHMFGAWSRLASGDEVLFTDGEIEAAYSRVSGYVPGDPSTDQGCAMADVLADSAANGIADATGKVHRIIGYAALGNPADENLLGQVLDVFGTVYVGISVQQVIQRQFAEGEAWDWVPGDPVTGGHAICLQRRRGSGSAPLEYVTWGALQPATVNFQAHACEEAWAPVTEDWVRACGTTVEGLDLQQLLADSQDVVDAAP